MCCLPSPAEALVESQTESVPGPLDRGICYKQLSITYSWAASEAPTLFGLSVSENCALGGLGITEHQLNGLIAIPLIPLKVVGNF